MKRCSDCRHWTGEPYTFRVMGRPTEASEHRRCSRVEYAMARDRKPDSMVFVLDQHIGAETWTRADFGCVLWEAKSG